MILKGVSSQDFTLWGEALVPPARVELLRKACLNVRDEFSNYRARFNTPAKLNNFSLTMEQIDKLAEDISAIKKVNEYLIFKNGCTAIVSYMTNIETVELGETFKHDMEIAKDTFREIRDSIWNGESGDVAVLKIEAELGYDKDKYYGINEAIPSNGFIDCNLQVIRQSADPRALDNTELYMEGKNLSATYQVDVPENGTYQLMLRYATEGPDGAVSKIDIQDKDGNNLLARLSLDATEGWTNYRAKTFSVLWA